MELKPIYTYIQKCNMLYKILRKSKRSRAGVAIIEYNKLDRYNNGIGFLLDIEKWLNSIF